MLKVSGEAGTYYSSEHEVVRPYRNRHLFAPGRQGEADGHFIAIEEGEANLSIEVEWNLRSSYFVTHRFEVELGRCGGNRLYYLDGQWTTYPLEAQYLEYSATRQSFEFNHPRRHSLQSVKAGESHLEAVERISLTPVPFVNYRPVGRRVKGIT